MRERFLRAIEGLDQNQLNWRLHDRALTIAEMAVHVAGVEVSFAAQLTDAQLEGDLERLARAATDGVVNDRPFPFAPDELTPERVAWCLAEGERWARPLLENPTPGLLAKNIVSALGPVIDGEGALARLAYHPGYHHGQAYLVMTSPGFPQGDRS